MNRFLFFISLLLLSSPVNAQNYVWPTNASHVITSSFGEFREGHFHAGIDISTWGKTGYRVFAVDSGYVWRISVSPYGGGKALYLKLHDGKLAVYYHLKRFSPKIESIVERYQQRSGKYRQNIFLKRNRIKVKKGETVAYTGSTGSGPAHLHVEFRYPEDTPINPFQNGLLSNDKALPVFRRILFTTLNVHARVNNSGNNHIYNTKHKKNHIYTAPPVVLQGKIGVAISCFDRYAANSNRLGIFEYEMFIDGKLWIKAQYDHFTYNQTGQIDIERDFRLWKQERLTFQKLYKVVGNSLNFYKTSRNNNGIIIAGDGTDANLAPGNHTYSIKIRDINDNQAVLNGTILVETLNSGMGATEHRETSDTGGSSRESILNNINIVPHFYDSHIVLSLGNNDLRSYQACYRVNGGAWIPVDIEHSDSGFESSLPIGKSGRYFIEYAFAENGNHTTVWNADGIIIDSQGGTIEYPDGDIALSVPMNCVYFPTYIRIKKNSSVEAENGNPVTDIYSIEPYDVPVKSKMNVTYNVHNNDLLSQSGLFAYNSYKKNWLYLSTDINSDELLYNTQLSGFETISVLKDTIPPEVIPIFPKDNSRTRRDRPEIKVRITDNLSDFASEESFALYINDYKVIHEYDPELKTISYRIKNSLKVGTQKVLCIAVDNVGNKTKREWSFQVIK